MSLARNTLYYSSALVYQKILGFIYFTLIARGLGVETTGQYVFALSFTTLFAVLADIGFAPVLTREVAKDRVKTQSLFAQVFTIKILISVLTYGLVVLFINILGYPPLTKTLVYIAGVIMFFDSFSLIFWAIFRGHQNLKYETSGVIIHQTITVALGLVALYLGLGVTLLIASTMIASIFYSGYSLYLLIKKLKLKLQFVFNPEIIKWFLKTALPFALAGVFARIYTQIDTVMLSKMGCATSQICDQQVGWYGIASKLTLALQFIPLALSAALFPTFSYQFTHAPEKLPATYEKSWRYLLILVVPLSVGMMILAPEIVSLVWGAEFLPAVAPIRILMASLIFLFLTFPNGSLLNALGRQFSNTLYMGIAVVVNIGLNIWLIPKYAMSGAAIASVASTFILFIFGFITSSVLIQFKSSGYIIRFLKIFIAAGLMGWTLYNIKNSLNLVTLIIAGFIIYIIIAYLLGEIRKKDFYMLKSLLTKSEEKTYEENTSNN